MVARMILLIAALGIGQLKPPTLFDACVANHSKLRTYSVHIDVEGATAGKRQETQYDLAVNGPDAMLRVREPAAEGLDRSDRTYLVKGSKLIAYDAVANERIQRTVNARSSAAERISSQLGRLDVSVSLALNPGDMQTFFSAFKRFPDWRTSHSGDVLTVQRLPKGSSTMFRFIGAKPLLHEVSYKDKAAWFHWNFDFRPGSKTVLNVPADARSVTAFTQKEAPPKYVTKEAKSISEKMLRAYSALQNGTIDVDSDVDGHSTLLIAGKRLRENRSRFMWAYDGSTLTIKNGKTGKFYRGKAMRVILSEYVTAVGCEVDPIIRRIVAHKGPFADLFPKGATVRLVGSVGTTADILEITSWSLKVSLFVRRDNHLIDSMESETVEHAGKVQTRSTRRFKYSHLGESAGLTRFRPDPGYGNVYPLPKIKGVVNK